ncbi:MAG TPA: hypothetical protein VM689_12930 [Aliidongia sp.]|nr:hypothetical protein [Aliidongia sp.]
MRYFWLLRLLGFEIITVMVHWSVHRGYFQVEDYLWLHLSNWQSVARSFYGNWGYGIAYRPLTRLSYWLDELAFGDWAPGWHFTNVALHGLAAALLAQLLERLGLRRLPATAAGLLFVAAPFTAESVAFISDRTTIICFIFMLLSALAWLSALYRPRRTMILAMVVCAAAAGMSYEAGFILPIVLGCLLPLAVRQSGGSLPRVIFLTGMAGLIMAVLLGVRALFLGMVTTNIDGRQPDLMTAITSNGREIAHLFDLNFGALALWSLAVAMIAALAIRGVRLAVLTALVLSVVLYLPFLMVDAVGDRFLYMAVAPLCVLPVLAANRLGRYGMSAVVAIALILFLPGFITVTHANSRAISDAGQAVGLLRRNIIRDLPNDHIPDIVDDVPFHQDGRPLFGDFFEVAVMDAVKPTGPWAIRTEFAEKSPIIIYDLMRRETHFWRLDPETKHLVALTKQEWLNRHSEIQSVIATISADGSSLGLVSQSEACAAVNATLTPISEELIKGAGPPPSDLVASAATPEDGGVIYVPLEDGFAAFIATLQNKGSAPRSVHVSANTGAAALPLALSLCENNPATGLCLDPAAGGVDTMIAPGTSRSFTIFAKACGQISLDQQRNRIFFDIEDGANLSFSTDVAVRTVP